MATLKFKGKNIIWNHHLSVPYHTLDEDEKLSYNKKKASGNLIVEGDNLLVMKSLLPEYAGKIKCIYIDPPYNTGEEGWIYNDNVNSPLMKEWLGKEVGKDDLTRHDKWLCMMTPRLKIMRELLADDGVIFISIDDNENNNLRSLMDEIFGENSFVTNIHVQMSTVSGQKVRAAKMGNIVKNAEYIIVYSKDGHKNIAKTKLYDPVDYDTHYSIFLRSDNTEIPLTDFVSSKGKIMELLLDSKVIDQDRRVKIEDISKAYKLLEPFRDFIHEHSESILRTDRMIKIENGINLERLKQNTTYKYEHTNGKIYLYGIDKKGKLKQRFKLSHKIRICDDYYVSNSISNIRGDWWSGFHYDMGNVSKEGDMLFLNGKKPKRLIKQIIKMVSISDDIILDVFAGSGTTAQAVLELNEEDNRSRNFILVQIPENNDNEPTKNICKDKTRERVIQVIDAEMNVNDVGFEYKRVGQPIDSETILSGKLPTYKQLAKYVFYLATGQTPKASGINEKEFTAGKIDGTEVYLLYKPDSEELSNMAITYEWAKKVAGKSKKRKVVYAPACFLDEEYLEKYNMKFVSIPYNLFERQR